MAGFFEGLAFRPQQGKRKRDGSPTPDPNQPTTAPPTTNVSNHANLAHRPKTDETLHDAKRRRANDPGDEIEADESHAVVKSDDPSATTNPNTDTALTVENLSLNGTVAQRVARRRRAVVSPFIPRKQPINPKAMVRKKPRPAPVFGLASLMPTAEVNLVVALRKEKAEAPQVKVAENLEGLPKPALDPLVENKTEEEENYEADVKVANDTVCVCGSVASDTLVQCSSCTRIYHPICIGKGVQDHAPYQDDRREQAMLEDAKFYRKNGGFTCTHCDDKALAAKQQWAPNELRAERIRRQKLFVTKHKLNQGETMPRECDHCQQEIISTRYECRYCENFDLCRECFGDPAVSSLHQHAAGDMQMR